LFGAQAINVTAAGCSLVVKKNESGANMKKGEAQCVERPGASDFFNLTPKEKSLYCTKGYPLKEK
jgi:hypothetical protein